LLNNTHHTKLAEPDGVEKNYGEIRALDGVNLSIGKGKIVALLGPNGAGKTTVISLLPVLLRPDESQARLFGQQPGSRELRRKIGIMLRTSGVPETLTVSDSSLCSPVTTHIPTRSGF